MAVRTLSRYPSGEGAMNGIKNRLKHSYLMLRTSALRQAFGRSDGQFLDFPDWNPAEIQPESPISGPEALLRNIG